MRWSFCPVDLHRDRIPVLAEEKDESRSNRGFLHSFSRNEDTVSYGYRLMIRTGIVVICN